MKRLFLPLFFLACVNIYAQQDLVLYSMQSIPQSMYYNPALTPKSKVNIGLPGISSIYINFSNSGFSYSNLVKKGKDDSLHIDVDNMISKLAKNNYINANAHVDLLSFGFRLKKNYFSFNATEKINVRFLYPKDFMKLVWHGNGAFLGETLNLGFAMDASHYREYALGMARVINDKLTVGGKFKYLYGMENVNTANSTVTLKTDPSAYDLTATADILVNTSFNDSIPSVPAYLFKKKNNGFGLDAGANYKLNDKYSFSASITDLGFITWRSDVKNYYTRNTSFTFEGIDAAQLLDTAQNPSGTDKLLDSLKNIFKINESAEKYTTWLSSQVFIGGNYHINEKNYAGVLLRGQFFHQSFSPSVTISYNTQLGRWLYASAGYSILNRSYNNLGLGFSVNGGPVQLYMASDNVLGMIFPQSSRNINLRLGINLTFGRPIKDKDKDGVADKKDKCPDTPGLVKFNGCPDRDNDNVIDKEDQCPDTPGLALYKGCPDKDGDGLIDKLDSCPEDAGPKELNGCPDKDGDKIVDRNDSCPDVPGLERFNGCPDKDGDEVIDMDDDCPDVFGLKAFKGCPDRDGDGTPDKEDNCPDKPGPVKYKGCPDRDDDGILDMDDECPDAPGLKIYFGCPDRDLDGVPDKYDECPDTYGAKENKGCPLVKVDEKEKAAQLTQQEQEVLKSAFDNLQFETGKSTISPSSFGSLDTLALILNKKKEFRLYVSGHTDNVGNPAANQTLSLNRAKAVKTYITAKGVDAARILTEGFGSKRAIAPNTTPEGKQRNRRVELKIIQ